MKKTLALVALLLSLTLGLCTSVFAVGSVTETDTMTVDFATRQPILWEVKFTIVADASAATVPDTAFNAVLKDRLAGWYMYKCTTVPGGTQPQALYDITIVNSAGVDVAGGLLNNRSASATESVLMIPTTGYPVYDSRGWTLKLANNNVNSAGVELTCLFVK